MTKLARCVPYTLCAILSLLSASLVQVSANGALYWFKEVRSNTVSVCFVGTAVTSRADRVQEIRNYISEFEHAANIRFNYLGQCPAPTTQSNGNDSYGGDIRVAIPNVGVPLDPPGMVPGKGCTSALDGGSWSNGPNDLNPNRPCLYNLKLGDDDENLRTGIRNSRPWLNHTLHEFGHAMGLSHEHARVDENAGCVYSSHRDYHKADTGYMTPYDKDSVMHYQFTVAETPSCVQIGSNYSDSGFTAYDRLALHILYPEDNRIAEFVGTTVIRTTETLSLQHAWQYRGANMNFVAKDIKWQIAGSIVTSAALNKKISAAGDYQLQFTYGDFLGRSYSYQGIVRVLTPEKYDQLISGAITASALLSM